MPAGRIGGKGLFGGARDAFKSEEEVAIEALFPTNDRFQMLQMITEVAVRAEMPWTVLGVFRRRFKSQVLRVLQEEHNLNKIAQERKGRLELSEIVSSPRRRDDKDKED